MGARGSPRGGLSCVPHSLIPVGSLAVLNIDVEKIEDQKLYMSCVAQSRDQQTLYATSSGMRVPESRALASPLQDLVPSWTPAFQSVFGLNTQGEREPRLGSRPPGTWMQCSGHPTRPPSLPLSLPLTRPPFSCSRFPSAAAGRGVVSVTVPVPSREPSSGTPRRAEGAPPGSDREVREKGAFL